MSSGPTRCGRCGELIWVSNCTCQPFYVRIAEWFANDDEAIIWRDNHELAAVDYVEMADCGDYTLATPGKTVEVFVRAQDETDWRKFIVEAEHILDYNAREVKNEQA